MDIYEMMESYTESAPIIVVKVTGKAFDSREGLRNVKKVAQSLERVIEDFDYRILVITGGGKLARNLIAKGRYLGIVNRDVLDNLGIIASRANAYLFNSYLGINEFPPETIEEAKEILDKRYNIIAMGGVKPRQSTTTVAARAAKELNSDIAVILTNVDYIFNKDPSKFDDAVPFTFLTYDKAEKYVKSEMAPGKYEMIDPIALSIFKEGKVTVYVINVKHPDYIFNALLEPNDLVGTTISYAPEFASLEVGFAKIPNNSPLDLKKYTIRLIKSIDSEYKPREVLPSEQIDDFTLREKIKILERNYLPSDASNRGKTYLVTHSKDDQFSLVKYNKSKAYFANFEL